MDWSAPVLLVELARATSSLTLAGLGVALLLKVARVQTPILHRMAWCAVLLVGCFLVRLPLDVPWYPAELVAASAPPAEMAKLPADEVQAAEQAPPVTRDMLPSVFDTPQAAAPLPPAAASGPTKIEASRPDPNQTVSSAPRRWPSWPELALAVWLAGIVALGALWLAGYAWFVWRLPAGLEVADEWQAQSDALRAQQGIRRPIRLRATGNLGPLLCRLPGRYELLVPEALWQRLNPAEREAVLRHELAHYARGDVWKSLAARAAALVHWFNPVGWWAVRRFDEAAEWACDRAATAGRPTAYARILMHLGELSGPQARYGSSLRGRPLAARIRRLVATEQKEDSAMKKALLIVVAASVVATALVRVQLVAEEPTDPPQIEPQEPAEAAVLFQPPTSVVPPENEPGAKWAVAPVLQPSASQAEAEQNMVKAAKLAFEAGRQAFEAENERLEPVCVWSNRWLAAELAVAHNRKQQISAATAHLARMRQLQKNIARLYRVGTRGGDSYEMATANYYVVDAERKLAELQTAPNSPPVPARAAGGWVLAPEPPRAARPGTAPRAVQPSKPYAAPNPAEPPSPAAPDEPFGLATPPTYVPEPETPFVPPPDIPVVPGAPGGPPVRSAPIVPGAQPAPPAEHILPAPPAEPVPAAPEAFPAQPPAAYPPPPAHAPGQPGYGALGSGSTKRDLRYDEKTFDQWRTLLLNDLSPALRRDAMYALAEFAANGYGREVTQTVFDVMRTYGPHVSDHRVHEMRDAAVFAISKAPLEDVLPPATAAFKSGNANQRLFAATVLPIDKGQDQVAPLLASAIDDEDQQVAMMARDRLAIVQHDNAALAAWLQKSLAGDVPQITQALVLLSRPQFVIAGHPVIPVAPFPALTPQVVTLLAHNDRSVRRQAATCLRSLGHEAAGALEREASKSGTEPTSVRARQLLDQILKTKPNKGAPSHVEQYPRFDWE